MKTDFWLEQIPLWGIFFLTVAVVLISIAIGSYLGQRRMRKPDHESESSLGTIISATLGLLAFMLAFTFGMAAERLQARKQLLLEEVNAIGTTYLRASLILEPHRSEIRKMLQEYVDMRVNPAKEKLNEFFSRSEALHDQMWRHAVEMAKSDRSSEIDALFISSLNEVIDLHNSRLTVFRYHIPAPIWNTLFFITILSMFMVGYQAGMLGKSSFKIGIVLALTFSAVVFLIADLDRASEGTVQVSQQPMFELQQKMQTQIQEIDPKEKVLALPDKILTGDKER